VCKLFEKSLAKDISRYAKISLFPLSQKYCLHTQPLQSSQCLIVIQKKMKKNFSLKLPGANLKNIFTPYDKITFFLIAKKFFI
jgi:hypothetical protein